MSDTLRVTVDQVEAARLRIALDEADGHPELTPDWVRRVAAAGSITLADAEDTPVAPPDEGSQPQLSSSRRKLQ